MSVLTEYFAAMSDDEASGVLLRPSGPAGVVIDGGGIEPVLQMLVLEAILTGRSEEDIDDDRSGEEYVAGDEVDGPSIVRLSDELTAALQRVSSRDLAEAAVVWADADEFNGATDPETLASFLRRLAELARSAAETGAGLYCWVSP